MHEITPGEQTPNGASDSQKPEAGPPPQPGEGLPAGEPETVLPSDGAVPEPWPKEDDSYPTRMSEAPFDMAAWADLNGWPTVPGYEILGVLGRGGMGVYQARQVGLGRLVALKMILAGAHAGSGHQGGCLFFFD